MSNDKIIHIFGGGIINHVRPHLALCAPAYGTTALSIYNLLEEKYPYKAKLHFTSGKTMETNADISRRVDALLLDQSTKMIFMTAALCDFYGYILGNQDNSQALTASGKNQPRLLSNKEYTMKLLASEKLIGKIRQNRKDIFLIGFKTTSDATEQEQYIAGLNLCKAASCNLVLANDLRSRVNMIVTPEEAAYSVTQDRQEVLRDLVEMAVRRSNLRFTRSAIVDGEPVSWHDDLVPKSLRTVVDHCIKRGAYKPFRGATAGHFAVKVNDHTFLTSRRKTNFNKLNEIGLVKVESNGPDSVVAYGSKPSVGGQSQRIVFKEHPDMDCIVHFHCPIKEYNRDNLPTRSQQMIECGSHECGQNTSSGLQPFGNVLAVMLDNHGPNIVFNRKTDPKEVIAFIEANFDLDKKSGGYELPQA